VGYVHGGALDRRCRGLQFSFDDELRALGLGNLLQHELIDWLCADGFETYDLGSRSEYKERWAESIETTLALLVVPQRRA
jgi:CelD/BcsL family acetyltransferase involved in cellulose biosynthesis